VESGFPVGILKVVEIIFRINVRPNATKERVREAKDVPVL
jgi:hypothetical protein